MPTGLTLMEAQAPGTRIRGTDTNIGMTIDVPPTQRMVITRGKSWTIPPRSKVSFTVDAPCLEAHKVPPRFTGSDANHHIAGMTENADVRALLKTLQEVEAEISANIAAVDEE